MMHATTQVYPKSKPVVVHRGGSSVIVSLQEQLATPVLAGFLLDVRTLFNGLPRAPGDMLGGVQNNRGK
ncbi:MAG TPA: hypothetical protein VK604_27785 [Bryobacteraceae bacterium]|nr:hypothetical protein [Bryobacteraceae bacterium]